METDDAPPSSKSKTKWPSVLAIAALAGLTALLAIWYFHSKSPDSDISHTAAIRDTAPRAPNSGALPISGTDAGYVEPSACLICHQDIWKTYQHTGMARSFFRPNPQKMVEDFTKKNHFYHPASNRYYTMTERNGKYFQRRHELSSDGKIINVIEKEIDYVMGSGNHARTYLYRTGQGKLMELPVGWYSEKGGYWAMNPGYDRKEHEGFRREIGYDCMFCHNAYPRLSIGTDVYGAEPVYADVMPEGIDCQRCHGPGRDHVLEAQSRKPSVKAIRDSIVNPARLSTERQMEVCMQCHLESSSSPLPYTIRRYGRSTFSYRPGEALADYALHFDRAKRNDEFEIAHAAYRFRQSACFKASAGAMTCTTCHNPHDVKRGKEAAEHYQSVCLNCHGKRITQAVASSRHTARQDCLNCHMPRRRTDDVVHVVMTDHFIQRRLPNLDLTAARSEDHSKLSAGEVVLYYPPSLPAMSDTELYLAVAQVIEGANLNAGIDRLERAVASSEATEGEFYYELAQAYRAEGRTRQAIGSYEEALRRKPNFLPALIHLGETLAEIGDVSRAISVLEQAILLERPNGAVLAELSANYLKANRNVEAETIARKALGVDPDLPAANNNLGMSLFAQGKYPEAEVAYLEAIRVEPLYADANYNLGNLLALRQDLSSAILHYRRAIESAPNAAEIHYNLGAALGMAKDFAGAKREFEKVVQLKPDYYAAHLNLGNLERAYGNRTLAIRHFEKAAASPDPSIRQAAVNAMGGGR